MSKKKSAKAAEKDWVYRDSTKRMLMRGLLIACAVSVLLELFVLGRKDKFGVDGIFGFYAALGFIFCTLMIFAAKGLGYILKVPTDHYDREDGDGKGGAE